VNSSARCTPLLFLAVTALPWATNAQSRPPIRQLGPVQATSTDTLGFATNIRALPGGRLLINDVTSRRVLLVDSTFALVSIVADSTSTTANAYGPRSGSLIAYRGDSTLFVDAASLSMLVIDPQGKIGRVMSVPRSQDAMMLAAGGVGVGAFYSNNHLVYRGVPGFQMRMNASGTPGMPAVADTMPIVRVNLTSRVLDTVAFVKIPKTNVGMSTADGKFSVTVEVNPLPVIDEWSVTSEGHIAIVRGKDYHVDWMLADGTRKSSSKMPFDWKRMTDDEKVALIDSVKAVRDRMDAANPGQNSQLAQAYSAVMGGASPPPQMMMMLGGGGGGAPRGAPQVSAVVTYVSPTALSDYQPAFFATAARADADGNVWIRTINTKPTAGGPVYDVINASGEVVDRVQIPLGRTIAGFGAGGVVFLAHTEGTVTHLERARAN
jgi:hypothetical protein